MLNVFKKIFGFLSKKKKVTEDTSHEISQVMKSSGEPLATSDEATEHMDFDFTHAEYVRLIEKGDFNKALPYLKAMKEKSRTEKEWEQFNQCITAGALNGMFWKEYNLDTIKWIIDVCTTRGCLVGFWINNSEEQKKVEKLFKIFIKVVNKKGSLSDFSGRLDNTEMILTLSKDASLSDEERQLLTKYLALSTNERVKTLKASVFSKSPELIEALDREGP
jgi:hypothetical protein